MKPAVRREGKEEINTARLFGKIAVFQFQIPQIIQIILCWLLPKILEDSFGLIEIPGKQKLFLREKIIFTSDEKKVIYTQKTKCDVKRLEQLRTQTIWAFFE